MICVDTTFLVDLWRERDLPTSASRELLTAHPGEEFAVPVPVAGEILEGGASVSPERLEQSLAFLRLFRVRFQRVLSAHHLELNRVAAARAKDLAGPGRVALITWRVGDIQHPASSILAGRCRRR